MSDPRPYPQIPFILGMQITENEATRTAWCFLSDGRILRANPDGLPAWREAVPPIPAKFLAPTK